MTAHQVAQLAEINAIVAVALPWLIALLKQDGWPSMVNRVLAAVCCVIAAVVTCAQQGVLSWTNWGASAIQIFTIAAVSYKELWEQAGAKALGIHTSFVKAPVETPPIAA